MHQHTGVMRLQISAKRQKTLSMDAHSTTTCHVSRKKEIVAVDSIADELMYYMVSEQGCYKITKEEQDALTAVVLKDGKLNRKCVGRDAKTQASFLV